MVIETKRLILRPFLENDAADVYEYLKEPAVNCFAGMKLRSLDEAREEEMLPGQRPHHLRRIRVLRDHSIVPQPPWLQIRKVQAGVGIHPRPRLRRLSARGGAMDGGLWQVLEIRALKTWHRLSAP